LKLSKFVDDHVYSKINTDYGLIPLRFS